MNFNLSKHALGTCLLAIAVTTSWADGAPKPACPLVPVPKFYRDHGRTWQLLGPDQTAIVMGAQATEPERYAAGRLQAHLERRFQRRIPIVAEAAVPEAVRLVFLLGQRSTNAWLDRLCREQKIEQGGLETLGDSGTRSVPPTMAGSGTRSVPPTMEDAFAIECLEDQGRQVVIVAGSNPRGVIYGQDALFDLMRAEAGQVIWPVVSVRDWPSIPWRGRPHSVLRQHLVPGALDAYIRARLNFTDVRDDPRVTATNVFPARKASMGFPAGVPIDSDTVQRMVTESHRRGLFVYGTVSCGVPQAKHDEVLETFRQLSDLGVDGLWVSFDDVGGGEDAPQLIGRVLEFGQQRGMTGRQIATTPPSGDYQNIDTPFNRRAAQVAGFADAQWFFTRVPCEGDAAAARDIGLRRLPGWWHNLVDFGVTGGFLHNGDVLVSLRADDRPGYVEPQPLSHGWHAPQYEQLRDADKYTDHVLLWGVVGGWPEEYQMAVLGIWAWNPAAHDWDQTRRAIYRYVYGPAQVETAWAIDDKLVELKSLFHLPLWRYEPNKGWPCRLKQAGDRPRALALIDELESLSRDLSTRAPSESAIDPARLESVYLEPLRTTLVYARKMTLLEYPEDWAPDVEDRLFAAFDEGDLTAAEQTLAAARQRLTEQLARIADELQGLKAIEGYRTHWESRFPPLEAWQGLAAQRRSAMHGRLNRLLKQSPTELFLYKPATAEDLAALFADWERPPAGKILAELTAEDWLRAASRWRGAFVVGPGELQGRKSVAIAHPAKIASTPGDYAEVRAELPVPKPAKRLLLDAWVEDTRSDNQWREFRFMQLWVNEQRVWEEDVAPDRKGRAWVTIDVSAAAQTADLLKLRFRVEEKRAVSNHLSVTFLGPVRLREGE
ncbi:MAG TPA: hypothetical protein PLF81_00745 [Candidatus Anammoximicrobium sp.]|nr:hypothetical protein [Candidatus Anammoximicrobium sp.]